jgi:hypothetical protein
MYVCMYERMHVCMYACMHVCMYVLLINRSQPFKILYTFL